MFSRRIRGNIYIPEYLFGIKIIRICCGVDVLIINFSNCTTSFIREIRSLSDTMPNKIGIFSKYNSYNCYNRNYEFEIRGFKIIMLTNFRDTLISLKLLQPTKELLELFFPIISKHNQKPKYRQIEIPTDFYVENKEDAALLQNKIDQHLFQTYQHKKSNIYPSKKDDTFTYYTSFNGRRSKFTKCYCRFDEGMKHDKGILPLPSVRLELTLNTPCFNKLNWPFPILQQNINNLDILKYQKFCKFNFDKFDNFLLNPKMKNDPRRKDIEKITGLTAKQYCRSIKDQNILKICEILKKIPELNHNRFIVPLDEENKILQKAIETRMTGYDVPLIRPVQPEVIIPRRRMQPIGQHVS
jgi:hypothetical protein